MGKARLRGILGKAVMGQGGEGMGVALRKAIQCPPIRQKQQQTATLGLTYRVFALADGLVVREGHVRRVQHVLQQHVRAVHTENPLILKPRSSGSRWKGATERVRGATRRRRSNRGESALPVGHIPRHIDPYEVRVIEGGASGYGGLVEQRQQRALLAPRPHHALLLHHREG